MMKVLLLGSNGQVGWEIARQAESSPFQLIALDRKHLDLTRPQDFQDAVKYHAPQMIINAAAYTAVDQAEQEPELAYAVNRDAPAELAQLCHTAGIPLIHISTDYVFDGEKTQPYGEEDPVNPLGVYGKSKWEGEEAVRTRLEKHIILRTSWVFGVHGNNFVKTILKLAEQRDELRIVADQNGCPTYAGDIAEVILSLCRRYRQDQSLTRISHHPSTADAGEKCGLSWGTYHYCGTPETTWHGLAEVVVAQAKKNMQLKIRYITAITTSDYPTPARRPKNSSLKCLKIRDRYDILQPDWTNSLEQFPQGK